MVMFPLGNALLRVLGCFAGDLQVFPREKHVLGRVRLVSILELAARTCLTRGWAADHGMGFRDS